MLIVDTHNDALLRLERPERGLTDESRHVTLEKMRRGNVAMMTFAAYTSEPAHYGSMLHMGLQEIDRFYTMLAAHGGQIEQVLQPGDALAVRERGHVGALLSVEGGDILEGDISVLRLLHRLGVRMFGLCWSLTNELATGCADTSDAGLKDFGRAVVAECGRLHMMVDLSHASDRTFWEVLDCAGAPVCASHSCARALCPDQRRNLTDDMLKAIGGTGGYVGVNFCQAFLIGDGAKDRRASVADVVRHLEHMAGVAGVGALGVGSDYDGISSTPLGLEDCAQLQNLAEALRRRNWKEQDVRGVMGENFLRYWARVCG